MYIVYLFIFLIFIFSTDRWNPYYKGYYYSVRHIYPNVWKQNILESAVPISFTHMLTILYSMRTGNQNLELSPNALFKDVLVGGVWRTITTVGVEEHRLGRPLFDNDPGFHYTHGSQRYTIKDMESVVGEDKIAIKISQNFAQEGIITQ